MISKKKRYIYKYNDLVLVIKNYFEITIFDKKYKVKYRTMIYKKIDTEKHSLTKVKNHGYSIRNYKGENYALSVVKNLSIEDRTKIANKIFNIKINDGTLYDEITQLWEKNVIKSQSKRLKEFDTNILEMLSELFLLGNETDDILDEKRWEKIKKYEVCSLNKKVSMTSMKNRGKVTQKTLMAKHKKKVKRWNKSINKKYYSVVGKYVDIERFYDYEWCYVNQENKFKHSDGEFSISKKVKNYKIDKQDEKSPMFKILVIVQDGNINYFDELYNRVENNFIEKVIT